MGDYRNIPHWTRDSSGEWAVCIPGAPADFGAKVVVSKSDGSFEEVFLGAYIEEGINGHLYSVDVSASDRKSRAKSTSLYKLNRENKTGEFVGSEGEIYQTSLVACSCPDFIKRGKTCKHMYRLAEEFEPMPSLDSEIHENEIQLSVFECLLGCFGFSAIISLLVAIFASDIASIMGLVYVAYFIFAIVFVRLREEYFILTTEADITLFMRTLCRIAGIGLLAGGSFYALVMFIDYGNLQPREIAISLPLCITGLLLIIVSKLISQRQGGGDTDD